MAASRADQALGVSVTRAAGSLILAAVLCACTAQYHARDVQGAGERTMTLGVVQKEIHKGLSQADVAEALGSPNIVTRDSAGLETWVYDKTATEASYSNSAARAARPAECRSPST
jgi:hypothetical protein